jgi:hypothetical protein
VVRQVWFDREMSVTVALVSVIPTLIVSYLGVTLGWVGVRKLLQRRATR